MHLDLLAQRHRVHHLALGIGELADDLQSFTDFAVRRIAIEAGFADAVPSRLIGAVAHLQRLGGGIEGRTQHQAIGRAERRVAAVGVGLRDLQFAALGLAEAIAVAAQRQHRQRR